MINMYIFTLRNVAGAATVRRPQDRRAFQAAPERLRKACHNVDYVGER